MMDQATRTGRAGVGDKFGEDLIGGFDQHRSIFRLEGDAREEGAADEVVELPDRLASLIARRDAERMQERELQDAVLGEQGRGPGAVGDDGEQFEQEGLGGRS